MRGDEPRPKGQGLGSVEASIKKTQSPVANHAFLLAHDIAGVFVENQLDLSIGDILEKGQDGQDRAQPAELRPLVGKDRIAPRR